MKKSAVQSMTGYAERSHVSEIGSLRWEIRSVNHRYLEIIFKIPDFLKELESSFREYLKNYFDRGKIECVFTYEPEKQSFTSFTLNESLVSKLIDSCETINKKMRSETLGLPLDLLRWPGVIQPKANDISTLNQTVIQLFQETIQVLYATREKEGLTLKQLMEDRLLEIATCVADLKPKLPLFINEQEKRIRSRFDTLQLPLDDSRLEQEMVYFIQKIDVAEELDRLTLHQQEAMAILKKGGAVGKRLDFMMQELLREANTLGSKSVNYQTTQISVQLKVLIDQIREQVQNIE